MTQRVLFVQGGGPDVHDGWDIRMVDSLRRELGDGYDVRYPRMPAEEDPDYERWSPAIRDELAAAGDGAIVVGHSVGAAILVRSLADDSPSQLAALVLIAVPFLGQEGWPLDEYETPEDLGDRLPADVALFHGLDDDSVPPLHVDLYARVIPQASVHRLPGRDHQLDDDLSEVADYVRGWHSTVDLVQTRRS